MTDSTEPTRKYIPLKDRVRQAEELALANEGKLPRFTRLMKIDKALAQATSRTPEAFAHIEKEANANVSFADHVKAAEELAAKNGGKLPSYTDLLESHPRLAGYVRDRKEAFKHIPRAKTVGMTKLLAARVAEAEALAKANGGTLELTSAFQQDHGPLVMHIRRHPDAFKHIPRTRRATTSLAVHVRVAEELAAMNEGKLPPSHVLQKNHSALDVAIRKHPTEFAHIPRAGKSRLSPGDLSVYVDEAVNIAKENGGVLPHGGRLRKISNNLACTIYRHPELFNHIPQEVRDGSGKVIAIRNQKPEEGSL